MILHPASVAAAASINRRVRAHVEACGDGAPAFRVYVIAGTGSWVIGHTGKPEPVTPSAVQRACTMLARVGRPDGDVVLKADGGRPIALDGLVVPALPFDPRLTSMRDFDPVVVIGCCDACGHAHRVEVQPGAVRGPGRPISPMQRGWVQGFMIPGGWTVPAVSGTHAEGLRMDCARCYGVATLRLRPLRGTHNAGKPCGARCHSATGPACDCACGGANHGAAHAAHGGAL